MKTNKNYLFLIFSLFAINTFAQQASTEIDSKSVKLPRYATEAAVTNALPFPTQGMMIYRTDTKSNWYFDGTSWKNMEVSSVSIPTPLDLVSNTNTFSSETQDGTSSSIIGLNSSNGGGNGIYGQHKGNGWAGYFLGNNAISANGKTFLNGNVEIANSNWLEFGKGLTKQEDNGKIAYNAFGEANTLSIVGGGVASNGSDRKIKMWANGGTYFTGGAIFNGDLGIGTDSPFGKLTVNTQSVGWNFPSLLLIDDAIDNTGGAILQFRNPADKRMYLQSHFGTQSDGTDTYMTFSHNAFYNMRLRGDGNLGIGSLNPNLAGLVVNKKVGNSHAIFGDNTSGVSIESNFPGIHFNSYYNGSRKTMSTGYTAGAEMNPTTGDFSIYTSPASTTAGSTASVFERLKITKDGVVNVAGKMKLGDDLTAPTVGTMRYNSTTNDFEGYDGTIWKSFTQPNGFWGTLNDVIAEVSASSVIPYGYIGEGTPDVMVSENYMSLIYQNTPNPNDVVTKFYKWENNDWVYMHQLPGKLIGRMTDNWFITPNYSGGTASILNFSLYKRNANLWEFHSNVGGGTLGKDYDIDGDKFVIRQLGAIGSTSDYIHIYKLIGNLWTFLQTISDPTPAVNNDFGYTLSLKNEYLGFGYGFTSAINEVRIYKFNGSTFVFNSSIPRKNIEQIHFENTNVRVFAYTADFSTTNGGGLYKINSGGSWELIPNTFSSFGAINGFNLSYDSQSFESGTFIYALNKYQNDIYSKVCEINYAKIPGSEFYGIPILNSKSIIIPSKTGYQILKKPLN